MPGPPVTIGCAVMLSPGASGPPDLGFITVIPQAIAVVGGMPFAVAGSLCQMVNSVSGVPYPLPIPATGSASVAVNGVPLIRIGDQIPAGSGVLSILGPPAAPFLNDQGAP